MLANRFHLPLEVHPVNCRQENREISAATGDGDGDRIGIIDAKGRQVPGDLLTAFLARDVADRHAGAPILLDVKSSEAALRLIESSGASAQIWKTGHSHMKKRMKELGAPLNFIRVHHTPNATFPNGIPNPLLQENHPATADVVQAEGADLGVAFDGDFDRCFFFDETGQFVPGEYVVGLLATIFLEKEAGARIVHDPRVSHRDRC